MEFFSVSKTKVKAHIRLFKKRPGEKMRSRWLEAIFGSSDSDTSGCPACATANTTHSKATRSIGYLRAGGLTHKQMF